MTLRTVRWRNAHVMLTAIAWLMWAIAGTEAAFAQVPGGCNTPVGQRTNEFGCYLVASEHLGVLSTGSVFWHLYNYPSRAEAEAAKGPTGTIVDSFGKVWLYMIADEAWRPKSGERVVVIGPLAVKAGTDYTARYMEAVFPPGGAMQTSTHRHSGAEAWYVVAGAQCLETPDGFKLVHAGETGIVPEGPPMALSSVGTETRKAVLIVLHDTAQAWIAPAHDWMPKGLCPK